MTGGSSIRALLLGCIAVMVLLMASVFFLWPQSHSTNDRWAESLPEVGPMPEHGPRGELPPRPDLDFTRVADGPSNTKLPGGLPIPSVQVASSPEQARSYLESVRAHLAAMPVEKREMLLYALVERGVDAPLEEGFVVGPDGALVYGPTLRHMWLDGLCRLGSSGLPLESLQDIAALATSGAPVSEAAAGRALVALARHQPQPVFAALLRSPSLLSGAPSVRAAVFATANMEDPAQRAAIEAYLRREDLSTEERAAFAQAVAPAP